MENDTDLYFQAEQCLGSGDDQEAETLFRRAVMELANTELDDTASVYNDWADARFARGLYDDVTAAHYAHALELLETVHASSAHPDVANVLNNTSALAQMRGR